MNKRIIAILLTLCVLFGFMPIEASTGATVSLSHCAAYAGEIVELELDLDGCDGFVNLGLELTYDSSILTLMSVKENSGIGATCTTAQTMESNPYNIGWDSTTNVYFNGTLASFEFLISKDAPEGEHYINIDYYKGRNGDYTDGTAVNYDENDNPLNLTYSRGCVIVKPNKAPSVSGGGGGGGGSAEDDETQTDAVTASLSSAEGYRGENVDVTLELSNNIGFANLGLEISYDSSVLTLLSVSDNSGVGATFTPAQSVNSNPYNVGWDSVSNVSYNGNLATFTFKIADDAGAGTYQICLSYYKGRNGDYIDGVAVNYDENDNPLDLSYVSGCVNVSYLPIVRPESSNENTYNGNVYMVFDENMTWIEASKICEAAGGHLATVTSAKENEFVQTLCLKGNSNQYYLGSTDTYTEGIWSWVNGESFVYNNWSDGEPNSANRSESYLAMYSESGKWSDETDCSMSDVGFVCEWEGDSAGKESVYWVEFVSQKDVYAIGEDFDVQVWLYTSDYVIRIYDYAVSGFDSSKAGMCSVTVSYGEYSQTFEVEVVDTKEVEPVVTHVVQSLATDGATISPSGYCEVNDGAVMKFIIGAKEGYNIDTVSVNGESVKLFDGNLSVTITQDTVIKVSGKKKTYTVEHTAEGNGTVEVSSDTVEHGGNCTARIVADEGYIISDVIVDGKSVGVCKLYTFSNIKENHSITAVFEEIVQTLTVKASAGEGGRITPAKSIINAGGSVKFKATPDYGYHIAYATVGGDILSVSSNEILLNNVTEDTHVSVVFEKDVFPVSVVETEGAQLTVVHNGQSADRLYVPYEDVAEIIIEPEDGYKLNTLYVNNMPVKAVKIDGKLVYSTTVTKNIVVSARCGMTLVSEFNQEVAEAGLAADINAQNASSKKIEFTLLSEKYTNLSDEEKVACTSAYATVLAALDRANAYIALNESEIVPCILAFPSPNALSSDNYRDWKEEIDSTYNQYEKLTYLSKSLIDYEHISKLLQLRSKAEELDRESKNIISYLYELIDSVPDAESIDADILSIAHSKLLLAEDTYYGMSEQNKEQVSEDMYNKLFAKHGKIATQIHKMYVTPFTSKVLRCSAVNATDSVADAEAKRVVIYDLVNEYHSFPAFVQEQISASTVQKMNSLYDSASIKVSTTVNNLPVDMNGDFDEEVDLVLTEPELDNGSITTATGKSVYQAIDVKMYSDNQEVQPTSKIRIKMEISQELSNADVSVIYINDDGVVYDVQGEVVEENGKYYIVFFIDHFSSFAVLYNENEVPETKLSFDREYVEIGDYLTATVTGAVNSANCSLLMVGYSTSGAVTFATMSEDSTVSETVAENTETVKAMLWDKNMSPIVGDEVISVTQ